MIRHVVGRKYCYYYDMEKEDIKFDLLTERFIINRWKTPIGREVHDHIIDAARKSEDVTRILEPYVLQHPAVVEPYEYPFYPPDAIEEKEFWVLTSNDLRGLYCHGENFSNSTSFAKTQLGFTHFTSCDLTAVDFEMTDLSAAEFSHCNLSNVVFAYCGGVDVTIVDSKLVNASFLNAQFLQFNLSGTDLTNVYFENTDLKEIKVNYLTKIDKRLHRRWHQRMMPLNRLPDLYRAFRIAYQRAQLHTYADHFLFRERLTNRKYVLWPRFINKKTLFDFTAWLMDFIWSAIAGYGTKPFRIILLGLFVSFIYAVIYFLFGTPLEASGRMTGFLGSIYFSYTTFATLGYGDLVYAEGHHIMRLVSTSEAILGAVTMALFVVVVARKIMRK